MLWIRLGYPHASLSFLGSRQASTSSSKAWLARQMRDPYVKAAASSPYRARSAFKLLQLQEKYRLFTPGSRVLDCGASPGGWSQVAAQAVGKSSGGRVLAVDLLPMQPIPGVDFIQGDLAALEVQQKLINLLGHSSSTAVADAKPSIHVVLSDMAPSMTGNKQVDHARSMHLCELALAWAETFLLPGGHFVCKYFMGSEDLELRNRLRSLFQKVSIHKPAASRKDSSEYYLVAQVRKGSG
ncbi:ribosomal RNA large subunit methyltransferase E [Piptocephalis cylindrospora]|uniref:rRNA methyltransferase 2, mitochondrial n=1 Tax=Piptocephalis cylindrospora TaxID=1907219 RepID=A0A4P9Y164_9FUNG|nr:ribosomal RNA large subunit methyltransferase E [Piptocephalis cylindrospora]|eukprot:RKP11801.1 ribosomal RNA large subunit methyltransferase E [Piptocephalis cylindrospora]